MESPEPEIEILAGTPPGGGQDRAGRALAEALDVETAITNMPGRGGGNAWDELATRTGDSAVASISSPTIITNKELGIAEIDDRDLTVLAHLCIEYLAFVVSAGSTIQTPDDVLSIVSTGRGNVAIATERGNVNHIALSRVADAGGADPAGVPVRVFDSARYAIADVIDGGSILAVVSAASTIPELESGTLRVVAVTADHRMMAPFDSVPTWSESGVDCVIGTWRGLVGPPDLGEADVEAWDRRIVQATATDSWSASVGRHHWASTPLDHAAARAFLDEQRTTLVRGLRNLGLSSNG
jgi:putative tricarboxylic transport membrane protein